MRTCGVVTGVSLRVSARGRSQPWCLCRQKPTCTPRGPRAWTSYHNDTLVEESRLLPADAFSLASPWRSPDATFPPSGHAIFTFFATYQDALPPSAGPRLVPRSCHPSWLAQSWLIFACCLLLLCLLMQYTSSPLSNA